MSTYGRLYNWYAVNDSRNIAPSGWHVPSDEEWKKLEMYLGMSQEEADSWNWRGTDEGGKMKTLGTIEEGDGLWYSPNTGATNESGFSALPSGLRHSFYGTFYDIGKYAHFWSSLESENNDAWSRILAYRGSDVLRINYAKQTGFSVRCIKD